MNKKSNNRGFTLIELLIVIFIIVLLTGIIVANLSGSRSKARDAQRISDLGQIQLALELFFDRCKQYPSAPLVTTASNGCPSGITFASYISKIPTAPAPGSYNYATAGSPPNDYILYAPLENYNEALKDHNAGTFYGITCDDGSSTTNDRDYCLGPK